MSVASQIREKTTDETVNVSVDCTGWLDDGELLTGTPTIPVVAGITISNNVINTAAKTINGVSVAIAKAIQFSVTGGAAGDSYQITMSCTTDSTPAQIKQGTVTLNVVASNK